MLNSVTVQDTVFNLQCCVINHPVLKESVELLYLIGRVVVFRSVDLRNRVGTCDEHAEWYAEDLQLGIRKSISDVDDGFDFWYERGNSTKTTVTFPNGKKVVPLDANPIMIMIISAMMDSKVSADEIRKGLNSYGVTFEDIFGQGVKIEKNYIGGWSFKRDDQFLDVGKAIRRL